MKTYIITGASSDIGTAFLREFEKDNEKITAYCQYFSNDSMLKELRSVFNNVDIRLSRCDLSSAEDTDRWIKELKAESVVPTHILHLAARKLEYMRLKQFDWKKTVNEMNIQVNSLAQLLKAFLPIMSKEKYGRVVAMISSCTLGAPPKFMIDYLISKYALLGLIKGAASEYAGTGITVNGLSPSMIETKFLSEIDPRIVEMNAQSNPMKRNINVDEVVSALRFLLSDRASYMNGVNLNLTGGERMYEGFTIGISTDNH